MSGVLGVDVAPSRGVLGLPGVRDGVCGGAGPGRGLRRRRCAGEGGVARPGMGTERGPVPRRPLGLGVLPASSASSGSRWRLRVLSLFSAIVASK